LDGFIVVEGSYPLLITALHGFGTDMYKHVVKVLRKCLRRLGYDKLLSVYNELGHFLRYGSAVDLFTWEIAYKVAVSENAWAVLPTLSKVDFVDGLAMPDYNLNKWYAEKSPFWLFVEDVVRRYGVRVVVDIHGMKNVSKWPDICISTRGFSSASKQLAEIIANVFRSYKLKTAFDYPFFGGAFIAYFGKPPQVEALAIEIKRSLRFYKSNIPAIVREAVKAVKKYIEMQNSL